MKYKIEMLNITKSFGRLIANDNVSLKVKEGEVHALLGENGAGKSTLMSILFGLTKQDKGIIKIDDKEVNIHNPNDATNLKIGMVHQHFKLVSNFTVAESIVLGNEPSKYGLLSLKECEKKIKDLSLKYGLEVDPKALIKNLSVGMQQRVEILKMLYRDANVLIFDEPTAVLTPQEITKLMEIIKNFAKEGKTIIIITHKLNEIKDVADRCTILRKGKLIKTVDVKETSIDEMASLMVGHDMSFNLKKKEAKLGGTLLEVNHLSIYSDSLKKDIVKDVSFSVKRGEILAIAGVEGNGQSELVKALWGLIKIKGSEGKLTLVKDYIKDTFSFKNKLKLKSRYKLSKEKYLTSKSLVPSIIFKGEDITSSSIRERILKGMAHVPEDRHKYALVLDYSLEDNLILDSFYKKDYSSYGFLKRKAIKDYADEIIKEFDIRSVNGRSSITREMSGGNQQKAVIAREISLNPDLLIAVQPTRGLDIKAVLDVHKNLINHRDHHNAVLLVSYELDEILNLADRILVMYNGRIVLNILNKDTNKEELGKYMLGAKLNEE